MTGNKLKIIACITMLLDHVGYILFPKILVLRYFGRLALPLFAYLIAEGCYYTKNRLKYLLTIFILGIICQATFFIEGALNGGIKEYYFNILFTLTFSIILCYILLDLKNAVLQKNKAKCTKNVILLLLAFAIILFITEFLHKFVPVYFYVDYGIGGVILAPFAILFKNKWLKLISFTIALTIFNLLTYKILSYTWFSYFSIIPIILYNGKRGKRGVKYLFYAFYPLHLAVIYLIQFLIV